MKNSVTSTRTITRTRVGVLGLAGVALIGGLAATAAPAGAALAKSPSPAPAQTAPRLALHSAVTSGGSDIAARIAQDGSCEVGDVCLYYLSSPTFGSLYDTGHNDPNLVNNRFVSAGSGQRSIVTNNAEFVWNRDARTSVVICTGAGYTGTCGTVAPNVFGNLTATYKNNTESLYWADSAN